MSIIALEENMLLAIEKDNVDAFIASTTRFLDWDRHRIDKSTEYLVHNAIRHKAVRILSYMLKTRIDINVKDEKSQTPLHFAIKFGMCEVVENIYTYYSKELELVEDWNGNTELHKWVIFHSNCESCLKILGKLKTLKNKNEFFVKKNLRGNSPLHLSIIYEMLNAFKLLISNKYFEIDITELGENNNSLLHFACIYKNTVIFMFLIIRIFSIT
jgi:ankyrin repeat protein